MLELLLREGPLRRAALSVGAGGDASPAPLLPLLVLKCWLQLTLYLCIGKKRLETLIEFVVL